MFLIYAPWCNTVPAIMSAFVFRFAAQALLVVTRISCGYGDLGRAMRPPPLDSEPNTKLQEGQIV